LYFFYFPIFTTSTTHCTKAATSKEKIPNQTQRIVQLVTPRLSMSSFATKLTARVKRAAADAKHSSSNLVEKAFLELQVLKPFMDKAGIEVETVSLTLSIPPAVSIELSVSNDPDIIARLGDTDPFAGLDESQLSTLGGTICTVVRKTVEMRYKHRDKAHHLHSINATLSLPPSLTFSFKPNK
jgi:hypothetical protein